MVASYEIRSVTRYNTIEGENHHHAAHFTSSFY